MLHSLVLTLVMLAAIGGALWGIGSAFQNITYCGISSIPRMEGDEWIPNALVTHSVRAQRSTSVDENVI
jgi:hypothetical protein